MPSVPVICLVTPSFNQGKYLRKTINSVLIQSTEKLQYIIIDGGSTDESVDIIKEHEEHLHFWRSHPDGGQYSAIEEGFAKGDGEILGWLNSDDMLCPWSLTTVQRIFRDCPEVEWITTRFPVVIGEDDSGIWCIPKGGFTADGFRRGDFLPGVNQATNGFLMQEATFWRRSLWEKAGGHFDRSLSLAADFELWARFFQHAPLWGVDVPLAAFRRHAAQKSSSQRDRYIAEARSVLGRYAELDHLPPNKDSVAWFRLRLLGFEDPSLAGAREPLRSIRYDEARARYVATCS